MQTIIITLNNGKKEEYVKGIKVKEILNKMSKEEREDAILIKYNNKKVDLETELKKNGTLQIYDINTLEGNRIYERGLLYLFIYVTNNVLEKDTKVINSNSGFVSNMILLFGGIILLCYLCVEGAIYLVK